MAGVRGLEPRPTDPKSAVLPLDDTPALGIFYTEKVETDLGLQKGSLEGKPFSAPYPHKGAHQGRKEELCQNACEHPSVILQEEFFVRVQDGAESAN